MLNHLVELLYLQGNFGVIYLKLFLISLRSLKIAENKVKSKESKHTFVNVMEK